MSVNRRYVICLVLVLILFGAGCQKKADDQGLALIFSVMMEVNSAQEFQVSLGVQNAGRNHFEGDETFHGQMTLRYAEGDRAGNLAASAEVIPLEAIAPGETAWPLAWSVQQLDPGAYTLTWGAEGYGETTVEFQIVERDGYLYLDY